MWCPYLRNFFETHAYPDEGAAALLEELERILAHKQLGAVLLNAVTEYESDRASNTEQISALLKQVREAAMEHQFPEEPISLLLFLLCTRHLETLYQRAGLSSTWFDGVARDLRSKLNECYAVRHIWGSFVAHWFPRFFAVDRFVIGRLQYELITIPKSYCTEETAHYAGQKAVNVHIPSGAPLKQEDVRASMEEAASFFAPHFPDGNIPFVCHSWLLFPGHKEMLPESSGIRRFMDEFTLLGAYEDPKRQDLWRIFHTDAVWDLAALPRDTSLQRAYLQWLEAGKPVGGGMGLRYIQS